MSFLHKHMKKNNNDFLNPDDDLFGSFRSSRGLEGDEDCPVMMPMLSMMAMAMAPKPLGMAWDDEPIEKFLKYKGYRIVELKNSEGEDICMAVKKDADSIPDGEKTNVLDVFSHEMQMSIIDFLIKNKL